jgi:hypothetical protein
MPGVRVKSKVKAGRIVRNENHTAASGGQIQNEGAVEP